jgi:transcriptional regulator with XRE-family HTH domain
MGRAPRNKPKRLAEKLRQIRKALDLSRKQMAARLSERTGFTITHTQVAHYEQERAEPFLETSLAYARLAGVEMNQIADDDLDLNLKAASELIIPDVYNTDVLPAVKWLQEHLPFSDEELAGLIGVSPEQFSDWKMDQHSLTNERTETLQNLCTVISRLLSFFNFRRALIMQALDFHYVQRDRYTPPWLGASLKEYLLGHGAKGIAEVDRWIQKIGSANRS